MSYEDEYAVVRRRFNLGWNSTLYPVEWPNTKLDPPEPGAGNAWVRLTIQPATADEIELGTSGRIRHRGLVMVQVFTDVGAQDRQNAELCDDVCDIFRGYSASGVRFRAPYVNRVGSDGTWYQQNVIAPYERDSTS